MRLSVGSSWSTNKLNRPRSTGRRPPNTADSTHPTAVAACCGWAMNESRSPVSIVRWNLQGTSPCWCRRTGAGSDGTDPHVPGHLFGEAHAGAGRPHFAVARRVGDPLGVAPLSRPGDTELDRCRHPILCEVHEVVQRHFRLEQLDLDVAAVLAALTGGDGGVVALDPLEGGAQLAVRHRLDHLEVLGDEPVVPLAASR